MGINQVQLVLNEGFERLNYSTKQRGVQRVIINCKLNVKGSVVGDSGLGFRFETA